MVRHGDKDGEEGLAESLVGSLQNTLDDNIKLARVNREAGGPGSGKDWDRYSAPRWLNQAGFILREYDRVQLGGS